MTSAQAGNSRLATAKAGRKDEFYTQLSDIEKELRHYRRHFKGKVVDAIDVASYKDIPVDYDGIMGVPVTLLDYFNPDQFEIIGNSDNGEQMAEIGVRQLGRDFIEAYRAGGGGTGHYSPGMRMLGLSEPKHRIVFKRILVRRKDADGRS